jgi:hypothetical protein
MERREQRKRHWQFAGTDQDITHEIYHVDAVLEFPGSTSPKPWEAPEWRAAWRTKP